MSETTETTPETTAAGSTTFAVTFIPKEEGKPKIEGSFNYDLGSNLDAAVEKFGADEVYAEFVAAAKVTLQTRARRMLGEGKTADEVQAFLDTFKLGDKIARSAVDPIKAIKNRMNGMTDQEKQDFLAQFKD